jgi:light-regulated signal transduction histidine kinase (bacteriophytochrome)
MRNIVLSHVGPVEVRSTAAEGTTFTVRLPRSAPERGEVPLHVDAAGRAARTHGSA